MHRTGFAPSASPAPALDEPAARARPGRRRAANGLGEAPPARPLGIALAGAVGLVLALAPLAGWGAGWPPLASVAEGWPIVSPISALGLALAAVGVAAQGRGTPRRVRRAVAGVCGGLVLLLVAVVALLGAPPLPPEGAAALVERWHTDPAMLLRQWPSPFTLGALLFLGAALALLAVESSAAVRGTWILAGSAALVALLTASPSLPEPDAAAAAANPLVVVVTPVAATSPPVALVVLLLASALLLVPTRDGGWWVSGRRVGAAAARLLLPGVLLLVPALVWLEELLVRRQLLSADVGRSLLATGLVLGLGLLVAHAVWRLGRNDHAEREREQRRLQRQLEIENEHAALRADRTLRVATDRYRAHLRGILEVSPTPFVAVDRDGHVAYLNGAAAALFGCRPDAAAGRPLWEVWPELGGELRAALGGAVGGAPIHRTLASPRAGRAVELRGYPDEAGTALFIRELGP